MADDRTQLNERYRGDLRHVVPARRPYWMPASNYYVLSLAIAAILFFVLCDILRGTIEETPWVVAGVSASLFLCAAVILREMILRRARNRYLNRPRQFDLRPASSGYADAARDPKLTIEQNSAILREIKTKSDAAKVLNRIASGHREVFELCREYLIRNEQELRTVNARSPRLAPLLKGRNSVLALHRYHTLTWAEIETRALTDEARGRALPAEQAESAQKALGVIEAALDSYPAEQSLIQSHILLRDMIVSIKVSGMVEEAEKAEFRGDLHAARALYRDALYYLGRDSTESFEREQAAMRINEEIERLENTTVDPSVP